VRLEKKYLVEEISENLKESKGFFVTSYVGLTAEDISAIHKSCRKESSKYMVVKNRVFKIAVKESGYEVSKQLEDSLKGSTAVVFSKSDSIAMAKMLLGIEKEKNGLLKLKGGFVEGRWFNEEQVVELSKLPSREVLLAKLMGTLKAPLNGFVSVLSAPLRNMLYVLNGIAEKKSE